MGMFNPQGDFCPTGRPPWEGSGTRWNYDKHAPMPVACTYRGWTLVDEGGWRWARKGLKRLRVCRETTEAHEARRMFRAVVDGEETP